jgi:hypothetical protein
MRIGFACQAKISKKMAGFAIGIDVFSRRFRAGIVSLMRRAQGLQ